MSSTAPDAVRPVLRTGSRVAAGAALLVAGAHLPMAVSDLRAAPLLAALSVLLCLFCLHCARSLWRRPTVRVWQLATVMAAGMLLMPALMPPAHAATVSATPGAAGAGVVATGGAASPERTSMAGMSGMSGTSDRMAPTGAPAGAGRRVVVAVGAVLEGPAAGLARWSLLLLAGAALVRCRARRLGAVPAPPA